MKKLFLTAAVLLMALTLAACSPKTAQTGTGFTDLMEQAGYTVDDQADRFGGEDVTAAKRAVEAEDKFTIEFYVFSEAEQAREAFGDIKDDLDKGLWIGSSEFNIENYNMFRGTQDGVYHAFSRIEDTLLYVVTEDENKSAVNDALQTLGYK